MNLVDLTLVIILETALAFEASLFESSFEATDLTDLTNLSWFQKNGI